MAEILTVAGENPAETPIGENIELIKNRRSRELVIGLCGAIGSGTRDLSEKIETSLSAEGYKVETIKISKLIFEVKNDPSLSSLSGFEKYDRYQDAGNEIREKLGNNRLAAEAIKEIISRRAPYLNKKATDGEVNADDLKTTEKIAYIIDQLKHPEEVGLLRIVYKHNFYLVGVTSTEKERKNNLIEQSIDSAHADDLIYRDKKDDVAHGQHVEKTFHLADYFIRNKSGNAAHFRQAADRFIKLIHGYNGVPPTSDESGMFSAHSASLKSACLSRQVGAAIMNANGDILSTGCNDVPASKGGLYTPEHTSDERCIFNGEKCYNDLHKRKLQDQFGDIISKQFKGFLGPDSEIIKLLNDNKVESGAQNQLIAVLQKNVKGMAEKLLKESKAKDLIEYSRAIHAEMDALIHLARTEGQTTIDTKLFTTTYPCHNCARHIVAAGVSRVIYIEPYEKSLALELHSDSISDTGEAGKVSFEPFEGVAPLRYSKFFSGADRKNKTTGAANIYRPADSYHIDPQYLDSYVEYEVKVFQKMTKDGNPFKKSDN